MFMAKESLGVVLEFEDKGSLQWHLGGVLGGEQQEYPLQSLPTQCPGAAPQSPPGPGCVLVADPCSIPSSLLAKCLGPLLTIPQG